MKYNVTLVTHNYPNEDSQKEGKKNPNEKDSLLNKKDFMCVFFKVCSKWLDKAAS